MTMIRDLTNDFQEFGPLAAAEYWQCRAGQVLISLEAGTDEQRGILLNEGEGFDIASGKTVYIRATGDRPTWVNREVTA